MSCPTRPGGCTPLPREKITQIERAYDSVDLGALVRSFVALWRPSEAGAGADSLSAAEETALAGMAPDLPASLYQQS